MQIAHDAEWASPLLVVEEKDRCVGCHNVLHVCYCLRLFLDSSGRGHWSPFAAEIPKAQPGRLPAKFWRLQCFCLSLLLYEEFGKQ